MTGGSADDQYNHSAGQCKFPFRSVLRNVTDNNGQYGFLQEWEPVFCTPDGMDKYFYIRHETAAQSFLTDCRAQDAKTVENCQLTFKGILRVKRDKHDYLKQSPVPMP